MSTTKSFNRSVYWYSSARVKTATEVKYFRYPITDTVTYGGNVQNWRRNIRQHTSATTSLSATRTVAKRGSSTAYLQATTTNLFPTQATQDIQASGDLFPLSPLTNLSGVDSNLEASVKTAFLSHCFAEQHKFLSLVFAGELGDTIRLIRSPFKSFRNTIDDYLSFLKGKKGRFSSLGSKNRFLSDSWLEFSLGVLPLINDIKSGAEALERLAYKPTVLYVHRSGRSQSLQRIGNNSLNYGNLQWNWVHYCQHEYDVKYYGVLRSLPDSPITNVASTFGLDLRSFVPSIWNLIPYSFLVDYLVNVNEFLESYMFNTALLGWCNRGSKGTHTSFPGEVKLTPFVYIPPIQGKISRHSLSPGACSLEQVVLQRSAVLADDLVPRLSFRLPFSPAWKAANAAALLKSHRRLVPF